MFKKTIVLAMAVGTVAAFASPTSASAVWGHKSTAIQQSATIGLTGTLKFTSESGGVVECQVTYGIVLEPGSTGKVESLGLDNKGTATDKCKTGGNLSKCQVHEFQPTELPWTVHLSSFDTIRIEAGEIHVSITGSECPITKFTTTPGSVFATTSTPHVIGGTLTLSGNLQQDVFAGGKAAVTVGGSLTVEAPNSGTYELLGEPPAWRHAGLPLEKNVAIGFTGSLKYSSGVLGSIECQITAGVQLTPGSTGVVETFATDNGTATERCKTGGALAACQVHSLQATGLPWTIHAGTTSTFTAATGEVHTTMTGGFCPISTLISTPAHIKFTPDNSTAIGKVLASGSVGTDSALGALPLTLSGELAVEGPNAGTYGIS